MKLHILQAIDSIGKCVYIDDVPNGIQCHCTCKECGGNLIAKNMGKIKIHHFSHEQGNDNIKCSQTALHLLAKEIILEERKIPFLINGTIDFIQTQFIEQEKNLGDIRPDLYAIYNGKPIAIEIFVSHAVDDIKYNKIQNHKLTTFQIDLSEKIFETKEEVKNAIYNIKNISVVYDEEFINQCINQKKNIISTNGLLKPIINGTIKQCPLAETKLLNGRVIKNHNVKKNLCKLCFFGYCTENNDFVMCIGHLNDPIPIWFFQVNLGENRLMSLMETKHKLLTHKKVIWSNVVN